MSETDGPRRGILRLPAVSKPLRVTIQGFEKLRYGHVEDHVDVLVSSRGPGPLPAAQRRPANGHVHYRRHSKSSSLSERLGRVALDAGLAFYCYLTMAVLAITTVIRHREVVGALLGRSYRWRIHPWPPHVHRRFTVLNHGDGAVHTDFLCWRRPVVLPRLVPDSRPSYWLAWPCS